ncbi:mitochondrial carrier [Paratrimastix pyriformis]|uniref:Mitochondrial carrier n=1 Tax=Paratrimastix pyriformis TaxID=342808 RepID=A0ABQ8UR12_9EUKA|nr:mitochondrial carrier [Paratrimastix pyriformis]
MSQGFRLSKNFANFAAGVFGGMAATAVVKPLDTLVTRAASSKGDESTIEVAKRMFQQEGISSFYRGLPISLMNNGLSWGLFYLVSDPVNHAMKQVAPNMSPTLRNFLASYASSIITTTVMNPLYCANTRAEANQKKATLAERVCSVFKDRGLAAFTMGLSVNLVTSAVNSAQIVAQNRVLQSLSAQRRLGVAEHMAVYAMGKMCATVCNHPLNVIAIRQRVDSEHGMSWHAKKALERDGLSALYRGFGAASMRVVPSYVITQLAHNAAHKALMPLVEGLPAGGKRAAL